MEGVVSQSSGDLAVNDHITQKSCDNETEQEMTDKEVENKDLDSDEGENRDINEYLTNQNATKW